MLFADDIHPPEIAWRPRPAGRVCAPRPGVHLWKINLATGDESAGLLSEDERERASQFRFDVHRRRYLIGRNALRHILAQYLDQAPALIRLTYNEFGKPLLADATLHFNLSHSEDLALIAVCDRPVGVDVEQTSRPIDHLAIASHIFAQAEIDRLRSADADERAGIFFELWTRQEAALKAKGCGLAGLNASKTFDAGGLRLHTFRPEAGFIAAVAFSRNPANSDAGSHV